MASHITMAQSMVTRGAKTRPRPLTTLTIGHAMVVVVPLCALFELKGGLDYAHILRSDQLGKLP